MLRFLVLAAALTVSAAASSREPACCDLWLFEPADGQSIAYAVEARGSGHVVAVAESRDHRFSLVGDGRELLAGWRAASHKPETTSVLIDAATSNFRIGPFEPETDDDPEISDGDTLILIRAASPAKARRFVDDIDRLPPEMNAAMKAVIPARGG